MPNKDINDVFDDILFTEERLIEESYQKGFEAGEKQENHDGYHLGYHRGAEIGAELGYYLGILQELDLKSPTERVTKHFSILKANILSFPRENIEDDILGRLDVIRAGYKKLCALLKLDSTYAWSEADKLNF